MQNIINKIQNSNTYNPLIHSICQSRVDNLLVLFLSFVTILNKNLFSDKICTKEFCHEWKYILISRERKLEMS